MRARPPAVEHAGLSELHGAARRTRLIRASLAIVLLGLVLAAAVLAWDAKSQEPPLIGKTSGVVVVDLSRSITDAEFKTSGNLLRKLAATNGHVGLVLFSDVAYELLPPQAPTSALRPFLRFFEPVHGRFPPNPWETAFRAGTKISPALQLAGDMLARNNVRHGSIILVSDLQTVSSDYTQLTQTLLRLGREGDVVRAVSLYPGSDGRQLFASILGKHFLLPIPRAAGRTTSAAREGAPPAIPIALIVLSGLVFVALAANERWAGRLALPRLARA